MRSKKTCSLVRHYFGGLLVYGGGKGGKITTCAREVLMILNKVEVLCGGV